MSTMRNSRPGIASRLFAALMALLLVSQSALANLPSCGGNCPSRCPCTGPDSNDGKGPSGENAAGNASGNLPADADGSATLLGSPSPDVMVDGFSSGIPVMPSTSMVISPASGQARM